MPFPIFLTDKSGLQRVTAMSRPGKNVGWKTGSCRDYKNAQSILRHTKIGGINNAKDDVVLWITL
jgi:hypothetical protein